MDHRFYLYSDSFDEETIYYLNKATSPKCVSKYTESFFLYISEDSVDFVEKVRSFEADTLISISIYIDELVLDENSLEPIYDFLQRKKNGAYYLKDVLSEAVLSNDRKTLSTFKDLFKTVLLDETIETGMTFIKCGNSSKASKELHIHRNTLIYRIDLIKEKTSLDLKDFINQLAFFGLFHK